MANMTADLQRLYQDAARLHEFECVGYTAMQGGNVAYTIYKGAVVMIDVSDLDGYAQPRQSGTNAATGDIFLGIAAEQVAITSADAANGSKKVRVWQRGVFAFAKCGLAKSDIGVLAYASDDGTVTTTSTNNLKIGYIRDVDDTYAWIDIDLMAGQVAA